MSDYFFNKNEKLSIKSSGFLPHWNQSGKIQFVTFRLIDSLPQIKIHELSELKKHFITQHPLPWNNNEEIEFWKLISPFEAKLLDEGYGSCMLKKPALRKIVSDSIRYFDGIKYNLIAYVIMPNHVHVLFHFVENNTIESVMHSIKSYTSKLINRITLHSGSIWMKEYFDRIIRNERHLQSCINYILGNPKNLKSGDFDVYVNPNYIKERQDAATPL